MWLLSFVLAPVVFLGIVLSSSNLIGHHLLLLPPQEQMWITLYIALYTIAVTVIWGTIIICSKIEHAILDFSFWGVVKKAFFTFFAPFMMFVVGMGLCDLILTIFMGGMSGDNLYYYGAILASMITFLVIVGSIYYVVGTLRAEHARQKAQQQDKIDKTIGGSSL